MGKKVKEYKAGDFIFAKVKGYPAWPARVQRPNGKKYFVYFYGTGETANLPPNQIFDYAENKDKFLTKTIKRKDFNDGARQIEHDFANNVPLEEVIGVPADVPEEPLDGSANDTANDSTVNDSALETTAADTTAADTTVADETTPALNETVEDSDEGALVIDEGKKSKKSTGKAGATPKPAKEPKTPRGKAKKEDASAKEKEDAPEGDGETKEEELVSRSGRKIRPKRYIDEQTEENATLPSPATKKRRGASPATEKEKEKPEKTKNADTTPAEKTSKQFNAISQVELEDLKEPFQPGEKSDQDAKKDENKKRNTVSNKTSKAKFQPPIKAAKVEKKFTPPVKNVQDVEISVENASKGHKITISKLKETVSSNTSFVEKTSEINQETVVALQIPDEKLFDTQVSSLDTIFTQPRAENEENALKNTDYNKENVASVQKALPLKSEGSFSLGNVIFGSLNLLNDGELLLSQSLSQKLDNNPVQSLSEVDSFCSLASLNKTYKDMDAKSFENTKILCENSQLEDFAQPQSEIKLTATPHNELELKSHYKIPHGDGFLKLFQDCKGVSVNMDKNIAMSILYGDMGPNRNYADYVKEKMGKDTTDDEQEEDKEQTNILIAYLPSGQYAGIKLFQQRPSSFKNDSARLQWHKQSASHSVTLKQQLERGHITAQSVLTQLEMDLNLTDEEKANLDKEREIEDKKSRVQFLKTEMKLIELDAKIKSCLSLEKADTDLCLKLLDELMELDIKCLMLLKHPTCLETVKRMRAYVGNTPSWEMSETDALVFSKQASLIRKRADAAYRKLKDLFTPPDGLSFWEYFSERVVVFKKCTAHLTSDERLEMVHEPLEMTMPTSHTMKASIESANEEVTPELDDGPPKKLKATPAKSKKAAASTPVKPPVKRQSSRSKQAESSKDESKTVDDEHTKEKTEEPPTKRQSRSRQPEAAKEVNKPVENDEKETTDTAEKQPEKEKTKEPEPEKEKEEKKQSDESPKDPPETEVLEKEKETPPTNDTTEPVKDTDPAPEKEESSTENAIETKTKEKQPTIDENGDDPPNAKEVPDKEAEKVKEDGEQKKVEKDGDKEKKAGKVEKEKEDAEPRAKRGRESNRKTEPPPPRSPAKRKSRS